MHRLYSLQPNILSFVIRIKSYTSITDIINLYNEEYYDMTDKCKEYIANTITNIYFFEGCVYNSTKIRNNQEVSETILIANNNFLDLEAVRKGKTIQTRNGTEYYYSDWYKL